LSWKDITFAKARVSTSMHATWYRSIFKIGKVKYIGQKIGQNNIYIGVSSNLTKILSSISNLKMFLRRIFRSFK
jgi:hypothetical protein